MSISRRYCFTLNNYTVEDLSHLLSIPCTYLVVGKETGTQGTPHLQGFVIFATSVRFNAAKALLSDRCHLEVARGTSQQASDYCKKDGDYQETGTLPASQGKRSDFDRFTSWVLELDRQPSRRELAASFPHLYARYSAKLSEIALAVLPSPQLTTDEPRFGWQLRCAGRLAGDAPKRVIDFYVDPKGNGGKSWMCQYALTKYPDDVQILRIGRRDDLSYSIDISKRIFMFDVPRQQMQFLQYSVLESLKDQMIFSPKYESSLKILRHVPIVMVFCNEMPDLNSLTEDRFNIIKVSS